MSNNDLYCEKCKSQHHPMDICYNKEDFEYKYFISFTGIKYNNNIFGNCIMEVDKEINNYQDIIDITKSIEKEYTLKSCIILNYILMK